MYSIFDSQTGSFLHTGRNSVTEKEAVDDAFDWLVSDWDEDLEGCDKKQVIQDFQLIPTEHKEEL